MIQNESDRILLSGCATIIGVPIITYFGYLGLSAIRLPPLIANWLWMTGIILPVGILVVVCLAFLVTHRSTLRWPTMARPSIQKTLARANAPRTSLARAFLPPNEVDE